jgi:N-acetyl-gamma-glutamyl-phosphate reductase
MDNRVFVDGGEGTAGLEIRERLACRNDISLVILPEEVRKGSVERKRAASQADAVILCLPDGAAKEAAALYSDLDARIIDCSTAHRLSPGWAYGFPELSKAHREAVRGARLIANPGCHATGFIAAIYPLVTLGILPRDYPFACVSLTGYSGGGRKMISEYEESALPLPPRRYALEQAHKHLPEMAAVCGLEEMPVFDPVVCGFYRGMAVTVPLHARLMARKLSPAALAAELSGFYAGQALVEVRETDAGALLSADEMAGSDHLRITVSGNGERMSVCSLLDNLGKGAAGAAVQNLNLALGLPEYASLR